jgi:CubicO group peptidase (beta-lactamase class C family)
MQKITATGRKMDVGLGWFRRHSDGTSTDHYLEHLGGGGGFFSMMRVYPDRGLGVIVMGNSSGYDHQRIASAAIARARGAPDA